MESYQDITFSTRIQDGILKDNQSNKKGNVWPAEKNLNAFLLNSERSFQDMAFSDKDPGCDPKGYSKARKGKCLSNRKAPVTFYWILGNPIRASLLSTKIQDGIPRDNQMDKKTKRLTCRKTLASFDWILWNLIRTSLFPPGSKMGSQRTTKATNEGIIDRQKNLNTFLLNSERSFQDLAFSDKDPG